MADFIIRLPGDAFRFLYTASRRAGETPTPRKAIRRTRASYKFAKSPEHLVRRSCAWYILEDSLRGGFVAQILALVDDIFFQAKMLETAKHSGVEMKPFSSGEALVAEASQVAPKLIVVDLNARQGPV
jgi:hypothetical protein